MTDKMEFNEKSFVEITKKYHENVCDTMECIVYTKEQRKLCDSKINIKLGISGSFNFVTLEYTNNINYYGLASMFGSIYDPFINSSSIGDHFGENTLILKQNSVSPALYLNIMPNWRTSFQIEFCYKNSSYSNDEYNFDIISIAIPIFIKREFLFTIN